MAECAITWHNMTAQDWDNLLKKCQHTTLLQSYPYAQAMRSVHQQGARHGLITIDETNAGIVQIQEVSLFKKAIHAISLDRGPLWFQGFGKPAHIEAFAKTLNQEFPKRFGRKRRFMPEFNDNDSVMKKTGWSRLQKTHPYQTSIINISPDLDEIRANMKKNWRWSLTKAEKNKLTLNADWTGKDLEALMKGYMQDRLKKRYAGPSPKILQAIAHYTIPRQECLILSASEDNEVIASILIFLHGSGATYQVGWTTPYGRDKGATHLLLWEAIMLLKDRGITHFDLGGMNADNPGLKSFKEGLGGQTIALIGSYD